MPLNMGEFDSGSRMDLSPYHIKMKEDMYCQQLCLWNNGRMQHKGVSLSVVQRAIKRDYHHNWIVDNLPSAGKLESPSAKSINFSGGFPVGFVDPVDGTYYIYDHV